MGRLALRDQAAKAGAPRESRPALQKYAVYPRPHADWRHAKLDHGSLPIAGPDQSRPSCATASAVERHWQTRRAGPAAARSVHGRPMRERARESSKSAVQKTNSDKESPLSLKPAAETSAGNPAVLEKDIIPPLFQRLSIDPEL